MRGHATTAEGGGVLRLQGLSLRSVSRHQSLEWELCHVSIAGELFFNWPLLVSCPKPGPWGVKG